MLKTISLLAALGITLLVTAIWCHAVSRSTPALDVTTTGTDPVPVLGKLPQFTLTSEDGQAFGSRQLAGKVWAANFIFTRCPGTCPRQTSQMSELQTTLAAQAGWDDIRLVSFSVDPEHDTPEVLTAYARQAGADPGHWRFLTGPRDDIWQLSKVGFKLDVGEAPPDAFSPLFHSSSFVLVDQQGRIRGYYDGLSEEGVEKASLAVRLIREQGPQELHIP
jgi:cytochrome oxidase Cu insertion factor (SCO1/SenC/PrrC family)